MKKITLVLILFLLTACSSQIKSVKINNVDIPVELAVTPEEHMLGLMHRTNLDGGMLFVYSKEESRSFWMKNTLIPLDMIFIGKDNKINTIHYAEPCRQDPCEIYSGNAKYVLEVNGNFTKENNIKEGMSVSLVK